MIHTIHYKGCYYDYENKVAKNGDMCLATKNPNEYCNGIYKYSSKDPGNGLAFVIVKTNNPNIVLRVLNSNCKI